MRSPFDRPFGIRSPFGQQSGASYPAAVATYYVNGSTGSDSDSGLTDPLAFLTLGKLDTTIGTTENVEGFIKGGLTYRESLWVTTSYTRAYGYDGLPTLDGSDATTGWVAEGTANVWQVSKAHDIIGSNSNRLRVWNTAGVELTRVANVATCSSTPGSYVALDGTTASPWTVKVRPTTGDPDPEGYFVACRNNGLALGDYARASDIIAKRFLSNNGAIELGKRSIGTRLLSVEGTKHNFLIGSGTLEDCIACRADAPTAGEPSSTLFVAYAGDPTGESVVFNRCFGVRDGGSTGNTVLNGHGTYPLCHASMTLRQFGVHGYEGPGGPSALTVLNEGFFGRAMNSWASFYADNVTYQNFLVEMKSSHAGSSLQAINTIGTWVFKNGAILDSGSSNALFRMGSGYNGVTLELRNLVINCTAFANFMSRDGMSSGTIKVYNCLFVANGVVANAIMIPTGVTYEGDYNVFVGDQLYCQYKGNGATLSLATWQSQSGQDANSVRYTNAQAASLWLGTVANGDFRLNTTGTGAAVAALGAGPQTHWDWNARAEASGPPTAWPVLPTTLAECETYISDPEAWTF